MRKHTKLMALVLAAAMLSACAPGAQQNAETSSPAAALPTESEAEETTTAAAPAESSQPDEGNEINRTTEVVVIGTGGAGMTAAYVAKEAGAEVIVIDKMGFVGGNTLVAGSSMNAADPARQMPLEMEPSELQKIKDALELEPENDYMRQWQDEVRSDIEQYEAENATYLYDSPALHALQTYIGGDYVGNPKLIDIYARNAPDNLTFLEDLGTVWKGIYAGMGATWRRTHGVEQNFGSNGAAFVCPQQNAYEELGGEILLEYKAEELIMEDGRVTGVRGTTGDGTPFTLTATKGVILATGGFAANVELRQRFNTHWATLDETIGTTNVPSATGDGIIMAEAVGANLVGMEWIQLAPAITKMTAGLSASINNIIYINAQGERFVREDGRRDEMSAAMLEQSGGEYFWLSDMHLYREIGGLTTYGMNVDEAVDGENLMKADTLEELAEMIGCDPQTLTETVNTYNSYVENNEDPEFGRVVFENKIDEGPFYALRGQVKVHHTMGGVEINENAEVLDTDGNVIPGLYAAGEVTGGIHGSNRLGGNAIADLIVFGRIAGANAAAQ